MVAVSCAQRFSYEERIEMGCNVKPKTSYVLIWSFRGSILPQLYLQAPDDIYSFKFNPSDPTIVVGGCYNGLIIVWDISEYSEILKSTNAVDESKKILRTPTVPYIAVSSIEASHRGVVQDIKWLPALLELGHTGEPLDITDSFTTQFVTASMDGTIAFWDLKFKKDLKSLDLLWRPFLRVLKISNLLGQFECTGRIL